MDKAARHVNATHERRLYTLLKQQQQSQGWLQAEFKERQVNLPGGVLCRGQGHTRTRSCVLVRWSSSPSCPGPFPDPEPLCVSDPWFSQHAMPLSLLAPCSMLAPVRFSGAWKTRPVPAMARMQPATGVGQGWALKTLLGPEPLLGDKVGP